VRPVRGEGCERGDRHHTYKKLPPSLLCGMCVGGAPPPTARGSTVPCASLKAKLVVGDGKGEGSPNV
jgi:hypothetical protein